MSKRVTIESIDLTNFKGIARLEKQFDSRHEVIKARTGAGKSTIMYAYFWVLGLDVPDVIPKFDNLEVHNLETKVEVKIDIDGLKYAFKRTQTEVWKTNKDTEIEEKETNASVYTIDDIEYACKKYQARIAEIFGTDYDKLEMLSNKDYFNSDKAPKWTWKERRRELFTISNTDELIRGLADKSDYELIATEIKKGVTTTDLRRGKMKSLKGCSDEKDKNATLLQDKQKDLQIYGAYNFAELEAVKADIEQQISALTIQEVKQDHATAVQRLKSDIDGMIKERVQLEIADSNEKARLENLIKSHELDLKKISNSAEGLRERKQSADVLRMQLVACEETAWAGDTHCSMCKQPLPPNRIDEIKKNFDDSLQANKEILLKKIVATETEIGDYQARLDALRNDYQDIKNERSLVKAELDSLTPNESIAVLQGRESSLREQLSKLQTEGTVNSNQEQLSELKARLSDTQSKLAYKKVVADLKVRIEEIKTQNNLLTDNEVVLKAAIRQIDAYISEQVSLITTAINNKFSGGVSFSLFSEMYANAESEIKETCLCMLDGKVYTSMSTGEKFVANLEVVRALQQAYNVNLPIFCDNAECYTNGFESDSQVIELRATEGCDLDCIKMQIL